MSVLFGLIIIFTPIYIAKYKIFSKLKKCNDFISAAVDFLMLNILLIVINTYTLANGYDGGWWYLKIALPIALCVYLALNIILSVRFLKANNFLKTGIILFLSNAFLYLPPIFIKVNDPLLQGEIDDANILKANLFSWQVNTTLEQNINLIVCLTLLLLTLAFFAVGLIRHYKINKV